MTDDEGRDRGAFEDESVGDLGEMTDTAIYEGELEAREPGSDQPDRSAVERLEFLESDELRRGEADNPDEAAEEGLTYVPPSDPPVVGAEDDGDPRIGAGFGSTADDEPYDADHHGDALPSEDEVTARVREALLADAATASLADGLTLDSEGGVVRVAGSVSDLEDETNVLEVISGVDGVSDVENQLRLEALD